MPFCCAAGWNKSIPRVTLHPSLKRGINVEFYGLILRFAVKMSDNLAAIQTAPRRVSASGSDNLRTQRAYLFDPPPPKWRNRVTLLRKQAAKSFTRALLFVDVRLGFRLGPSDFNRTGGVPRNCCLPATGLFFHLLFIGEVTYRRIPTVSADSPGPSSPSLRRGSAAPDYVPIPLLFPYLWALGSTSSAAQT